MEVLEKLTVKFTDMALNFATDKALVWDKQQMKMVVKTRVSVSLLGNRGSVFAVAGPLYVETPQEIVEAVQLLKSRLLSSLPGF